MTLQFSGHSERVAEPYTPFEGRVVDTMPLLVSGKDKKGNVVDVPRDPASFTYTIERRETAPEDVRETWQRSYVFTGDAVSRGVDGDVVSTWDSAILRTVNPESRLVNGALTLSTAQWKELREQKDGVLYLSAEQVVEVHGKGYVKKEGVWTPENTSVAKVWEHLSRGRDLKDYVKMVADAMPNSERIMGVYLDQAKLSSPNLRSWVADRIGVYSDADGDSDLGNGGGRLVGVAPEAQVLERARGELSQVSAREKVLEARVHSAIEQGLSFERIDGLLYVPVDRTAATQLRH